MAAPDLYRAFQELGPEEQRCVLRWEEEIGADLEHVPPLAALVQALAIIRVAEGMEGPVEARWQRAALVLGMDASAGDTARRKLNHWRSRASGKKRPDIQMERAQISGR